MDRTYCRLCGNNEAPDFLELFQEKANIHLVEMIHSCLGIEVQPDDGFSQLLCNVCFELIDTFFHFKQKCVQVYLNLKNEIENSSQESSFQSIAEESNEAAITTNINQDHIINKDIEKKEQNKKHQCELCGLVLTKRALKTHLISHSGKKSIKCKLCSKKFTRKSDMIIHMRAHMDVRPYVCEICGNRSARNQDLTRHKKIHSDEKEHACPVCERRFKRSSDVYAHIRTHTGVRPFSCKLCEKTYTSHGGLRKHMKTHTLK